MQLVQLIQYRKIESFSMFLSNMVMNVSITPNDLRANRSFGFDTSLFNKKRESLSFNTNTPIPIVQYCDSHTWTKYCEYFMELDLYGERQVNKKLNGPFRSSMIDFLRTNLGGTATYSANSVILHQLQSFLKNLSISELETQEISSLWDQHLEI